MQLAVVPLRTPTVSEFLIDWGAACRDTPYDDVPTSMRSQGCPQFAEARFAMLLFDSFCEPPKTDWLPRKPRQIPTPGYDPQEWDDLFSTTAAESSRRAWMDLEVASMRNYASKGEKAERINKEALVGPESERHPGARGNVYHRYSAGNGKPELVDFHAEIESDFNNDFIRWVGRNYADQEQLSYMLLGVRSKANVHTHSLYCPSTKSLRCNYPALEKQTLKYAKLGFVTMYEDTPTSPARYISVGTAEKKDDPTNHRVVHNDSAPLGQLKDADGHDVLSINAATRLGGDFPPNPHENKPDIPKMTSDAVVLKHVGDMDGTVVYQGKLDMSFWFDQFSWAMEERWQHTRLTLPLQEGHSHSTHTTCKRIGFGGRSNSNVGQRGAYFVIYVLYFFMDKLEQQALDTFSAYEKQWLQRRTSLNQQGRSRQDRLYSAWMFTDDLWFVAVTADRMHRMLLAAHLTRVNLNLVFADHFKMGLGTGLRIIGGSMFMVLAIVAIPAQKVIRAVGWLDATLAGKMTAKLYEKLGGLAVHCLFLAFMDATLLEDFHDPVTHVRHVHGSTNAKIKPSRHQYLRGSREGAGSVKSAHNALSHAAHPTGESSDPVICRRQQLLIPLLQKDVRHWTSEVRSFPRAHTKHGAMAYS